ncbi:MAG: multidrug efflux pump subunit AcrB, partial [Thermoproteota archaeon]
MYKLIDYFVNRSLLVNLVSFIVVMIGIYSIVTLQKETFPMVDFETIVVRANYFGASAEDVEKLVTVGIERELKEIDGIEDMNALSGEGYSIIIIKIDPDFETDDVLVDVRNAVDSASDIPDDVEKISIRKMINTHRPIIKIAVMGDDEWLIRRHVRELRDELERIKGIAKVRLDGYRDEIIEVAVDKDKIIEKEVTLTEVARAIKDRNINISAGSVKDKDRELIVRTLTEYKGVKDIRRVVIRSNDFGENVKVMDISKVTQTLRDDSSAERAMGKSAIIMEVVAKSKADILNTTTKVKNVANNFFEKLDKKKISSLFMNERAFYVKRRLNVLTTNGLQGLTLVFICLMFFLNFKTSVITSLGAPLAFLVAFSFMQVCGVSINLISMFALILVLGMLVDDSIIVAENFYQKLEDGVEPEEAAKRAAKETLAPVSATILTTIVAFGTLFFLGGIMGKFLWPVPAVIIICLMASWFECFFILPSHLKDFVKLSKKGIEKDRWYKPLIIKYEVFLTFTLRHSKKTVIFFGLLLAAAINVQFTMEKELFPGDDVQIVLVKVKGKVGKPFARTTEVIKKLEKIIMEELGESEYENLTSVVGSQFSPLGTPRIGSHYGQVVIYLTMQDFRERKTEEIINQITQKAKAAIEGYEL